jgi:hypothetical protein
MDLPFTHKPGRRERHLRRRHENPLFALPAEAVPPETLLAAQKADHDEMVAFGESLRALLQRAVDLPPDAGSDAVLGLKEAMEQHYEQACGLPEDHAAEQAALARLIDVVMGTVRRHTGADPLAQQELDDEEAARAIHFSLLQQPLVADMLHPESPIRPQELTPSLLSASTAEADAACELFSAEQLAVIVDEADALCARLRTAGIDAGRAERMLDRLRERLRQVLGGGAER